jgi:RecJ-like exonuclease
MKTKHCSWCDNSFETSISYQIYCSPECRNAATKEKITERYIKNRRNSRVGKVRKCKSCGQSLSIYNDDELCSTCQVNPGDVLKALKEIKGIANGKNNTD